MIPFNKNLMDSRSEQSTKQRFEIQTDQQDDQEEFYFPQMAPEKRTSPSKAKMTGSRNHLVAERVFSFDPESADKSKELEAPVEEFVIT